MEAAWYDRKSHVGTLEIEVLILEPDVPTVIEGQLSNTSKFMCSTVATLQRVL